MRIISLFLFSLISIPSLKSQDFSSYAWSVFDTSNCLLKENHIREILFDTHNQAWVLTQGPALYQYKKGNWKRILLPGTVPGVSSWTGRLTETPDHQFLITGDEGILYWVNPENGHIKTIKVPGRLRFFHAAYAKDGALILATSSSERNAVYAYQNNEFTLLATAPTDIFSLAFETDRKLLVSCRNGTYRLIRHGNGKFAKELHKLSEVCLYQMRVDSNRNIYGCSYPGMRLKKGEQDSFYTIPVTDETAFYDFNGSWQACMHALIQMPDNRFLGGTQFGPHLIVQTADSFKGYHLPVPEGQFDGIQTICYAPDSSVWVGTWYHGIFIFSDSTNKNYLHLPPMQAPPARKKPVLPPRQKRNQYPDPQILLKDE